ncbi:hypothetical protein F1C58_01175 [Glaciihabitans sp. INWT7]|uniref:hypothetical protein n=1 Tax=Glaciihabitans sp. INWT7 TaxID=2596912 RepID=UPI001624F6A0|nr:hypothetical protein [Glaciihabitans sp. INWT7]QNE45670.1 hypothetical protein F1C58_01175 [Glaciihabitans sp. INWT7]
MLPSLEVAMVLPGAVGVCCTLGDRVMRSPLRRSRLDRTLVVAPSVVMMLAMGDLAFHGRSPLVMPIGWILLLVIAALLPVVALRRDSAARTPVGTAMAVHRSLTLLLTATTIAAMGSGAPLSGAAGGGHQGMVMANPLVALLVLGIVAVAALTLWLIARLSRRVGGSRVAMVEAMSMFGGVVVMVGAGM